jgi:hypothetical protein
MVDKLRSAASRQSRGTRRLGDETTSWVERLTDKYGETGAAECVMCTRTTIFRVLARRPVMEGTIALFEAARARLGENP